MNHNNRFQGEALKKIKGQLRIIGGKWRGRRLFVPSHVRPTPDRIRETLFNWLSPVIVGAHCLDAFAGSGALGIEALSRGAKTVVFVDSADSSVKAIQNMLLNLKASEGYAYQANVPHDLKKEFFSFNIVFLDPPYRENLLIPTCIFLEENAYLANPSYIYLEAARLIHHNELPPNWRIIKNQKAGQVFYHLICRETHS